MLTIVVVIATMFAIPIAILVYEHVRSPSPYEQLAAMFRDPKQRARARRILRGPRRKPKTPPPREPVPIAELADDRNEESLLADLRAAPGDAGARMVYADWLEQRGEAIRAAVVRGERVGRSDLMASTDVQWRAICMDPDVPEHQCESQRWSALRPIANDPFVRECPYCDAAVRFCATVDELRAAKTRDELAIVDPGSAFDRGPARA